MGINIPASSSLGSVSSQFFWLFFFFSAKMNLTVFAGILLAVTMATARRASLGEKTMQAAGKADEPEEAMRESASLVEKIMRAADEADEPAGAKRANAGACKRSGLTCTNNGECCGKCVAVKSTKSTKGKKCSGSLVEKIMRAAHEADEPAGAKRANGDGQKMNKRMKRKPSCYYDISCNKQRKEKGKVDPMMQCCVMADELDEAKRESLDFGKLPE